MTPVEALKWIFETFDDHMKPWIGSGSSQEETYHCWGCDSEFISIWPKWEKPTDKTFPHELNCKYINSKRLVITP